VNHAVTGNYSQFAAESMNILNQIDTHMEITATGGPGGQVVTGSTVSSVDINQSADLSTAGAEGNFSLGAQLLGGILHQNLLGGNYAYGMRTLEALMTMTKEMARLPGRKTILYMSDGMILPAENPGMLDAAIGLANRSNVSFYSIDTRGLMTASVGNAANASLRHGSSVSQSQGDKGVVSTDQFKQDDSVLYAVKSANTQGPMATLAESTGGFLIANTNDLKPLMARVMEDVVEHYEVSFSPTTTNFDGKFRRIAVKLERKGLHAQSRNGFYDLPFIPGQTVLPYELPALKALNEKSLPHPFPFQVGAFRFRPGALDTQCSMAFEVPISALKSQPSESGKETEVHATFLALVKDSSGQIVAKVSQDIPYQVPADKFELFRKGNVIVTQVFEVPAGVYSIEAAVVDRLSQEISTKRSVFVVESRSELGLSSIALARRVDPLKEARNLYDPMQYAGGKITPSLTDTVLRGEDASVYFQIYPSKASNEKPELTLDFFVDGQQVASETPELPKPDANGTIPFVATAKLNPGNYMVRATVKQGSLTKEETSSITVQ
jgi:VWFA-related protein